MEKISRNWPEPALEEFGTLVSALRGLYLESWLTTSGKLTPILSAVTSSSYFWKTGYGGTVTRSTAGPEVEGVVCWGLEGCSASL